MHPQLRHHNRRRLLREYQKFRLGATRFPSICGTSGQFQASSEAQDSSTTNKSSLTCLPVKLDFQNAPSLALMQLPKSNATILHTPPSHPLPLFLLETKATVLSNKTCPERPVWRGRKILNLLSYKSSSNMHGQSQWQCDTIDLS